MLTLFCFDLDVPEFVTGTGVVNISVIENQSANISCNTRANPPVTNVTLSHDTSATNIELLNDRFMISRAGIANQGQYTCTATNLVGITELVYNVVVGCK